MPRYQSKKPAATCQPMHVTIDHKKSNSSKLHPNHNNLHTNEKYKLHMCDELN